MHHIASDGWSMAILHRELSACYDACRRGVEHPLPPLRVQYADYAVWQRGWLHGEVLQQQLRYWRNHLQGTPALHGLPLDRPRPARQTYAGRVHRQDLDDEICARIRRLCKAHEVTAFMFMQTAFAVLVGRFSNETD